MDFSGGNVAKSKDYNAPVNTQPYNAPVVNLAKTSENSGNPAILKQAGLGNIICEQCGKEAAKRIYNQRFCCTPCRLKFHGYQPTKRAGIK